MLAVAWSLLACGGDGVLELTQMWPRQTWSQQVSRNAQPFSALEIHQLPSKSTAKAEKKTVVCTCTYIRFDVAGGDRKAVGPHLLGQHSGIAKVSRRLALATQDVKRLSTCGIGSGATSGEDQLATSPSGEAARRVGGAPSVTYKTLAVLTAV